MRSTYKGLIIAGVQVALVASLGGKYLTDRARLPRVWARAMPFDPALPLRGRYLRLQLQVQVSPEPAAPKKWRSAPAELRIVDSQLRAVLTKGRSSDGVTIRRVERRPGAGLPSGYVIAQPVAFFIPGHASNPIPNLAGGELWAEVSVPPHGPPRPIRLAVKRDGTLTPLPLN